MACVVLLLFSGCLPSQDKSVGIICLGLESLIPIMSTRVLYKQLGEVGGVLRLTSASQLYLHSISAKKQKKIPESLLPCHRFNRERVADHKATLQTQAVNFSETTTIRTHQARICSATHTPTHALLLFRSQTFSQFLTPISAFLV